MQRHGIPTVTSVSQQPRKPSFLQQALFAINWLPWVKVEQYTRYRTLVAYPTSHQSSSHLCQKAHRSSICVQLLPSERCRFRTVIKIAGAMRVDMVLWRVNTVCFGQGTRGSIKPFESCLGWSSDGLYCAIARSFDACPPDVAGSN